MDFVEIKISDLIKDDTQEYKSLMDMNKHCNMQEINTRVLNTRGTPNKEVEISRYMKFKLSPFDILHFDDIELVTTSGGGFYEGKIIQENTGGFGTHSFVHHNYNFFKKLKNKFFIPTNKQELKQIIKILNSFLFGKEQKSLRSNKPKILWHSPNWDCFSHFSFEEFPRLLATLKALKENKQIIEKSPNTKYDNTKIDFDELIIIAPIKNTWQFDQYIYPALLSLTKEYNKTCPFAIKKSNIICVNDAKLPQSHLVKVSNVFVPTQVKFNKNYLVDAIEFLRNFYYDIDFKGASERIYISRAKSAKRFLSNEVEFRELLEKKYGFKTLYMEEVTFKDKINYLSRAKVLLSIDGTSIMNYGYMKQGSKVISLRPANMAEYPLDYLFGVEFLPIICDIVDEQNTDHMDGNIGTWWASNLYANIPYVEEKFKIYGINAI